MIVTKKTVRTIQPFVITSKGILMVEAEKKETFMPIVTFKDNKLNVNMLLGDYGNITVKMYDEDSNKIMENKNYGVLVLHKMFNISALPKGSYVIEIRAGDEHFFQTIEK